MENGKENEIATPESTDNYERLAGEIGKASSSDAIQELLRHNLLATCGVEMASIFLIDSLKMQLVSWLVLPGESLRKIRIPIDKTSIAGYTASSREVVLIEDPYDEEELLAFDPELKFDSSWDAKTGTRTRQLLAAPILVQRSLLGVIQLMNKCDGRVFTPDDIRHVRKLASTLGSALLRGRNAA
ncbi:MAG: hypothetical protein Kow0089_03080 [Desulfobulbaceae bacterium]